MSLSNSFIFSNVVEFGAAKQNNEVNHLANATFLGCTAHVRVTVDPKLTENWNLTLFYEL